MLNLRTTFGNLHLAFEPAGTRGYDSLTTAATVHRVGALRVRVAALRDVIHSKEKAGRTKEARALPGLRALELDQQRAAGDDGGIDQN